MLTIQVDFLVTCTVLITGAVLGRRTLPPNNPPPNMAAANFVVITNGEGCALNGTAVAAVLIDQ